MSAVASEKYLVDALNHVPGGSQSMKVSAAGNQGEVANILGASFPQAEKVPS